MGLRKPGLVLLAVGLAAGLLSLPTPVVRAEGADLRARVAAAVARRDHIRVGYAVGVWDVQTGERIYAHAPDTPRRTASVMKLATTAAALLALGPDHALTTNVFATVSPTGGVVNGDLLVRGGGDPGFSSHFHEAGAEDAVRQFAKRIREAGIRRVTGSLVLDTSAYPGPARHPGWGWKKGKLDWWSAPVTALTINDACLDVAVQPGPSIGAAALLSVSPRATSLRVTNSLLTVEAKKEHKVDYQAREFNGEQPAELLARGGVWLRSTGYEASLACVDPPALFGDVLRAALAAEGVEIVGPNRVERAPRPRVSTSGLVRVATHATDVGRVVDVTNTKSQNLLAELLLREVGRRVVHDGSYEGGCAAVRSVLGIGPDDGFTQEDGSGLSRGDKATANAIGRLLLRMYASGRRVRFMSSLARAGEPEGTLRKRLRAERFRGRVLAKTGTLRDTSALAGYVHATDGRVLAFAVLCEGAVSRSRDLQDEIVSALVGP